MSAGDSLKFQELRTKPTLFLCLRKWKEIAVVIIETLLFWILDINARIKKQRKPGLFLKDQSGFRKGRSCTDSF
jgi:hypothetical protein